MYIEVLCDHPVHMACIYGQWKKAAAAAELEGHNFRICFIDRCQVDEISNMISLASCTRTKGYVGATLRTLRDFPRMLNEAKRRKV
ncbi:hypothetical protein LguiB_011120 [Lonicera macranthoides]